MPLTVYWRHWPIAPIVAWVISLVVVSVGSLSPATAAPVGTLTNYGGDAVGSCDAAIDATYTAAYTATGYKVTNVVLMGMGEPLLNYEQTARALPQRVPAQPDVPTVRVRQPELLVGAVQVRPLHQDLTRLTLEP